MSLEQRIAAILESDVRKSPWESLISLFQADREAFYTLACDGVSKNFGNAVIVMLITAEAFVGVQKPFDVEGAAHHEIKTHYHLSSCRR